MYVTIQSFFIFLSSLIFKYYSLFDALWIALLVFIVIIIHTIKVPYCSLLGGGGCFELLNIPIRLTASLNRRSWELL